MPVAPRTPHFSALSLLVALAMTVAACSGDDDPSLTTTAGTAPSITSLAPPTTTTTTTTTTTLLPPATTGQPPAGIEADVADLIAEAEQLRGLGFIIEPDVELLDEAAFAARVGGSESVVLSARDRSHNLLYRLAGRLEDAEDLGSWRSDLTPDPEFAWYDVTAKTLLVVSQAGEYGPLARSEIIHEVIHALTDQHYSWSKVIDELVAAGSDDRLIAMVALIEGDASYFQLVYVQSLSIEEQREVAEEFLEASPEAATIPEWAISDIVFPFEAGFEFVRDLVSDGGIAAVDRSYSAPPVSTEQILHPGRYERGETPVALAAPAEAPLGYEIVGSATLGEWAMRILLEEAMSPGFLTQTADGWGGDAYGLFESADGAVALAIVYIGDTEDDAIEVTQGFIDFAEDVLKLGDGARSGGGQAYSRSGRPWMFIDREGLGILVVLATERSAGRELADGLSPP